MAALGTLGVLLITRQQEGMVLRKIFVILAVVSCAVAFAEEPKRVPADPGLAKQLGADERGMRKYVLVILKTGPNRVPDGNARKEMFEGHFANMKRLAGEGKLVVAGPFGEKTDWRGMFVFAVDNVDDAKALVATDPVIKTGEMVADYHTLYASAGLMAVNGIHEKIEPK